jgi:hypothetical protein
MTMLRSPVGLTLTRAAATSAWAAVSNHWRLSNPADRFRPTNHIVQRKVGHSMDL